MKNVIIDKPFSDELVERIKGIIADSEQYYYQAIYNQRITNFMFPEDICQEIVKIVEDSIGESDLELTEYQFARYAVADGDFTLPNLAPHFDDTFPSQRFTFDYQLGGNTTWPIVVEEKEFTLENNQALTFSGTHQIHWRTHKDFGPGEYVDMIFCHLSRKNPEKTSAEHKDLMQAKKEKYEKQWEQEKKYAN